MLLLVDLDPRQRRDIRAGGDDDGLGFEHLLAPSAAVTSTRPGAAIRPVPVKAVILFFLNRKPTPLTLPATVSSLCFIIAARSSFGGPTTMPSGAKRVPGLLEHFGGMQQRLGGDAADVEAGAAKGRFFLDDGDCEAELRRADGADIAAGAGADDDEIVGHGQAFNQ